MDAPGAEPEKPPQGWFVDPFGIHQHRWFSEGRPTALVRDDRTEGQDPPPAGPVSGRMVPATPPPQAGSSLPGAVGTAAPLPTGGPVGRGAGGPDIDPIDLGGPPTPGRVLRLRLIALAGAVLWTVLVALQFRGATTTVTVSPGQARTETVYAANPGAVVSFTVLLTACCTVTGVSLILRIRAHSQRWSRSGCVCAGVLAVLGVVSLATVGLALLLLAFLLFVVARPLRRPGPLSGERVVPTASR
jgi:hypothetical protein